MAEPLPTSGLNPETEAVAVLALVEISSCNTAGFGASGEGGFGGGRCIQPNFVLSSAGAGAGGGAGLGGAVAVLDGELIIEDCLFDNNQAVGGSGGNTDQNQDVGRGENGMGYGNDVFTLRAHPELDAPDISSESCEELTNGTAVSCEL